MTQKTATEQEIDVAINATRLKGILGVPPKARGVVIFAHGSGSGRLSPRNNYVANILQKEGIATLLLDLLTPEEESDRRNVFDIDLLARRLKAVTVWVEKNNDTRDLAIGYFGASTGAAAALASAARLGEKITAIVSRGGRPDLAMEYLPEVKASTLLIVGGDDLPVIAMNEEALQRLNAKKQLTIIPGATHLFEEEGKLDDVARHAAAWFKRYL